MESPTLAPTMPAPLPPLTLQDAARLQIRRWMTTTGTTQGTICTAIGRNQPWLSRFLNGAIDADLDTLAKIARVFDHSLFALLAIPADPEETHLIQLYRSLRLEGRKAALAVLQELARARKDGPTRR